jgi:hypothetical protein
MRVPMFVILGLAVCGAATTAAAQTVPICVKPWAIPDKWIDMHDEPKDAGWDPDDTFETVDSRGAALSDPDVYVEPGDPASTGFTVQRDHGLRLTLKIGDPKDRMRRGWFLAVDIGLVSGGASAYRTAIATCQEPRLFLLGDRLQPLTGALHGPTIQGVADLINQDPTAVWDYATQTVVNSCAPSLACGAVSPRIVAITAFNPAIFESSLINGGQPELVVTNFIGVFIDGIADGKVTGYLTSLPGR